MAESDEVEKREDKDPNKIYKVPVKSNFLDHLLMLAPFEITAVSHEEDDDVDDNS